jgi:hypothetical protein
VIILSRRLVARRRRMIQQGSVALSGGGRCAALNAGTKHHGQEVLRPCRSPLSSRCPKCGAENAPSSAFCEDCGAALGGTPTSSAARSLQAAATAASKIRITPEQPTTERVEHTGAKAEQAEMLRYKGEMLLMQNGEATSEAEACFQSSLEVAQAQETRWWQLRATTSLARLLSKQGRHHDPARCLPTSTTGSPRASTPLT